ncbi:MAG: type II toxin-antitoxin system RelE/ParE family toxin [Phycisphaerae bacterium]|nr:type II toxin-antitoxin system RelE/ParE family toxin [Phycisphaerae bacterium]
MMELQKTERGVAGQFKAGFRRICDMGKLTGNFKKEQGHIWAFKYGQYRIACYQAGDAWVLTNGFQKKKNKWPKEVFERAEQIRKVDLERVGNERCNKKCKP